MPHRLPVRVLTAGGVLAACLATAAPAGASTIHACVKPKSGATRIVSAKARCRHGEKKLSWSTTGPTGAPGAVGASGPEGKAGASGEGPVYSAAGTSTPITVEAETILLSKVLPPGSYDLSAKLDIGGTGSKHGNAEAICALVDVPGTTPAAEGTSVDLAFMEQPLGEPETGSEWTTLGTMTLQGTMTSKVTSTVSAACGDLGAKGAVVKVIYPQLQALAVTAVL